MAAITVTFKCYRADFFNSSTFYLGAQVGASQVVTVPDTKHIANLQLVFIDTGPNQAGTYLVTGETESGTLDFDQESNITLMAVGP